jgi:hypothetical protein
MARCTGRSKVKILGPDGKGQTGADGKVLVELDEHGKPVLRPCKANAVNGQTKCVAHGGRSPQAKAKGAERVVEEKARATLVQAGAPPVADPLTALGELAGQVLAFKDALGEQVNRLESIRFEDAKGGEQLRSEVVVLERAFDRCAQILALIAKLNIDERLAKVTERQADAVVQAIDAALAAAGITGQTATEARHAAAVRLRSA